MGFLDWILGRQATHGVTKGASLESVLGTNLLADLQGFQRFDEAAWAAEFDTNGRLSTPIHNLATDVAKVRWRVKRATKGYKDEEDREVEASHPLRRVIDCPHPVHVQFHFFYILASFFLLVGKCPVEIITDNKGDLKLVITPPHWITEYPRKDSPSYKVQWWSTIKQVPIDSMILFYAPSLVDPFFKGVGLAKGIDSDVNQDKALGRFNDFYFRNMAFLGAIINVPGADPDEVYKKWKVEREGVKNAFKTMIVDAEKGVQVHNLAPKFTDLNFIEGQKLKRDLINQRFGQPPERQGILENSNRSTIDAADFHQQANNVLPIATYFCQALNAYLVPRFNKAGSKDFVYIDFDNPVREDAQAKLNRIQELGRLGALTINEIRSAYGHKPLDHGDVLLVPTNNVLMVPADKIKEYAALQWQQQQGGNQK